MTVKTVMGKGSRYKGQQKRDEKTVCHKTGAKGIRGALACSKPRPQQFNWKEVCDFQLNSLQVRR